MGCSCSCSTMSKRSIDIFSPNPDGVPHGCEADWIGRMLRDRQMNSAAGVDRTVTWAIGPALASAVASAVTDGGSSACHLDAGAVIL